MADLILLHDPDAPMDNIVAILGEWADLRVAHAASNTPCAGTDHFEGASPLPPARAVR